MENKKKLFRLTTVDLSLDKLIKGQLRFLSDYYDVVGVASDTGLLQGVAEREGIRVIDVPMRREISLKEDLRSLWNLYKLFKREKPDILHCNTPKGSLLGLIAGKITGIPFRIYLVTGLRYQGATGWLRVILKMMEKVSCFCATNIIPEGNGVLHTLRTDGITTKPMRVLHHGNINGVDTEFFCRNSLLAHAVDSKEKDGLPANLEVRTIHDIRSQYGFSEDDFVFVFIGRIVRDKGIRELVGAMRKLMQLPVCSLQSSAIITVDGEQTTNRYQSKVPKLLLVGTFENGDPIAEEDEMWLKTSPSVRWIGWQEDVRPCLAAADALVFPSYREGFPNVPMQAGAMNLASIVTDINGCNEIIKDGLNGRIIVAPLSDAGKRRDEKGETAMQTALYETMRYFLEHPAEVKRMGANARDMIVNRYEQKDVWTALLEYYRSLEV
ncbi:glycosyltransferase family 4 protein [Prevotella sp. oral taxon 376]|uniref:glycosyltransferase family 4 protein n=1 Tax=Prevotella sp. oral taxon 376 TaxID=712466 RepID=UPI001E3EAA2E|nr:glycosyltransferase family 4 protein [Prevotella sp. oral taxon 376]